MPLLQAAAFYASLALFGAWAGALSLGCFLFGWLPDTARAQRMFQRLVQRQVAAFLRVVRWLRVVEVEYRGWERVPAGRVVLVANHPGLLDAFFLLARMPRAFCIFKPAIRRNPLLAAAARRAGYLANDSGIELVRCATQRLAGGAALIVFPEGTRTPPGGTLGAFRPGFALIARRARVPVQMVRIAMDRPLLAKGQRWWPVPQLPVRVVVQAGPRIDAAKAPANAPLVTEVENWFRGPQAAGESGLRAGLTPALASPLTLS